MKGWIELTLLNNFPVLMQVSEIYHLSGDPLLTKAHGDAANCIVMFSSGPVVVRETYDEVVLKIRHG